MIASSRPYLCIHEDIYHQLCIHRYRHSLYMSQLHIQLDNRKCTIPKYHDNLHLCRMVSPCIHQYYRNGQNHHLFSEWSIRNYAKWHKHKIQLHKNNLYKFQAFEAIVANANKRTRCILTRSIFVKGFDESIIRHSWIMWGQSNMDHNLWCICELIFQTFPKSHPSPTNLNESHSSISLQKYPFPSNPK